MGYRRLLKTYMAHLQALSGSTYVDELADADVLSQRELGELRSIAAEIHRERCLNLSADKRDPEVNRHRG